MKYSIVTDMKDKWKTLCDSTGSNSIRILYNMFCEYCFKYENGQVDSVSALCVFGFYKRMFDYMKSCTN